MKQLEPLVGRWNMVPHAEWAPPGTPSARVVFEWMPGGAFLVERWEVPVPEAPDGLAVIGPDPADDGGFLQHYFDSRGVARIYKMRLEDGLWTLTRTEPDFSPLDFLQRFTGRFSSDGRTIEGTWEACHDGTTWEKDFDLTYERA